MDFKKGSTYTRNEIHMLYHDKPAPNGGDWMTGYVREGNELIVFMNIDVPGRTGHDFENKYDEKKGVIEWFGKPGKKSANPQITQLMNGELTGHFFARWDNKDPFTYLGIGKHLDIEDGHPTVTSKGKPSTTFKAIVYIQSITSILPASDQGASDVSFPLEQELEKFIVDNWTNTELGTKYDVVGKQYQSDTGPMDILAISKDKREFLVIELKKGRASDKVVGQIQRYMGWVQDELAESEMVKGLIIALEDDLKIKRALSINKDIEFKKYKISFNLSDAS